ncbi:hypothetical protein H4582DRAFT_2103578 [Lactarius indigo]|nr:hypothetical protein H4582DRAFT_2103578 [Lactarius indigo]
MSSVATSRDSLESMDNINKSTDIDLANAEDKKMSSGPTDITEIPDELSVEADDRIKQSEVLNMIIASNYEVDGNIDNFNNKEVKRIDLSELKKLYERKSTNAVKLLSRRNRIKIDEEFCVEARSGNVGIRTNKTMIDYHLTIGNRIGLSAILPNVANSHRFSFELDLGKPYREFKGKHAMVGFDTKDRAYMNVEEVYEQNLENEEAEWDKITNILEEPTIRLNFEDAQKLDSLMANGYKDWVEKAPDSWKLDGFLKRHSPIVVTSRYGQNAAIALAGNEDNEAESWDTERDYSKISYVTFALATSIECFHIHEWETIATETIREKYGANIYDKQDKRGRQRVKIETCPMVNEDGDKVAIFDRDGKRIPRRRALVDPDEPDCGVLMNLEKIHSLFNPDQGYSADADKLFGQDLTKYDIINVDVYPLGFLRTAGNVQASGIPPCFYRAIAEINKSVCKEEDESSSESSWEGSEEGGNMRSRGGRSAVKPVSSQFYNYISHRVATRAGRLDSQQGTVTAALAGAFAQTDKEKATAKKKQAYCDQALPSDRFHTRIDRKDCPTCCRAELVYSVDVRALRSPSGKFIFKKIIVPLARVWRQPDVRKVIKQHIIVLKPNAFPSLYDWVSYPITLLIKSIYDVERKRIRKGLTPCHMHVELVAALERALCFCHTGNAAVLATSLMGPLGLSKGALKDGFPMLQDVFEHPTIGQAMEHGLVIAHRKWPLKNGYPAVASKKAQVLSYSMRHFHSYQAKFRIQHSFHVDPPNVYPGVESSFANRAMRIVEIALTGLLDDTKQLVMDGVRADIAARISQAPSEDSRNTAELLGRDREKHLKKWLSLDNPLSYSPHDHHQTYQLLLQAVVHDPHSISHGLPNLQAHAMTLTAFVQHLLAMSSPHSPSLVAAPVQTNGSFLPLLIEAHRSLHRLSQESDLDARDSFAHNLFLRGVRYLRISFVPSHRPRSSTAGASPRKPVFDSWAHLGLKDAASIPSIPSPPGLPLPSLHFATVALNHALSNDSTVQWFANALSLDALQSVLNKTSLPHDFVTPSLSHVPYIDDTYSWVRQVYNGSDHLHHLALLVAIIASSLLPNLFMPLDVSRHRFANALSHQQVRNVYSQIDWVSRNKKGMSDRSIFIAMITSFIIALYDPSSPLRTHMSKSPRRGLGDDWTKKHSVKGVTVSLLIRLGAVWGKGPGAFDKGSFSSIGVAIPQTSSTLYILLSFTYLQGTTLSFPLMLFLSL